MNLHCFPRHRFVGLLGIGLVFSCCARLSESGTVARADDETDAPVQSLIQRYEVTDASDNYRVTLLGITSGVAFLASPGLVSDDGRTHGNHAVPWIRVTAMIEQLGNKDAPRLGSKGAPYAFRAETADGRALVQKIGVPSDGTAFPTIYQKHSAIDMSLPHLVPLFPTAPPKTADPDHTRFFVFHLSGDVRNTETATLHFRFGTAQEHEEVTFENVPIP